MPPQKRCIPHLLNLCAEDFQKKYLNGLAKTSLIHSLSKLHSLFVLTHRSSRAKTICKAVLGCCLKIPCKTRWNSTYDAVSLCTKKEIQKNLNALILELKREIKCQSAQHLSTLVNTDFAVINQYVSVMEPVAIALDIMQGEEKGSQSFIMPVLLSMKHRITHLPEPSTISRDFKCAMLASVNNRFKKNFQFESMNKDLLLSAVTIPQFKGDFIEDDENIIFVKNLLICECKKLCVDSTQIIDTFSSENASQACLEENYIISFGKSRQVRRNSIETEIESEVSRFLCDMRVETTILQEYPKVREVYFKYNTTLASSAPIERVFSQSQMIFTPRRNRLTAKLFEQSLFLKVNKAIQKKMN